jgi:UDPglucose 6-dehydrogenase
VRVHDPKALDNARRTRPGPAYIDSAVEACRDADAVLHLTEWAEYRALDPLALGEIVAHRRLLDGRNVLDSGAYVRAGWDVRALGRPHVSG